MGQDKQVEEKYIIVQRKGAVGPLVLDIVGDLLFESTFQNTNEDVIRSFSCLYLQKTACPLFILQRY